MKNNFKIGHPQKRGMEMAISTIIIIALGLLVLVGTLYMLIAQKGIFKESVDVVSSDNNVDELVLSCNDLVGMEKYFSYCCEEKTANTGKETFEGSCFELKENGIFGGRIQELDCSTTSC
jgi:hypothetical protein